VEPTGEEAKISQPSQFLNKTGGNTSPPMAVGNAAVSGKNKNDEDNEIRSEKRIIPISKILYVNKTMNIWVVNVRSISGKTDESAKRKDHVIDLIQKSWPEAIILIETNHEMEPRILPEFYDNFFTIPSKNKGIIILTKKLLACEKTDSLEDRGLVLKSRIISDFTLIGIYCPYYSLRDSSIEFLQKNQKGFWFIAGDMENYGNFIINNLDRDFWGDFEYSRETPDNKKTKTEYVGYFYEKPKITILEKISDHFLLNCEIHTKWEGLKISFPPQISRISAICSLMNYQSKATSAVLGNWPEVEFKKVITGLIPLQKRELKIYKKEISMNDISTHLSKHYKKIRNTKILCALKTALVSNNLKSVANIASKCLHIQRKGKKSLSVLGITGQDGKINVGDESIKIIKEFYGNLFNKYTKIDKKEEEKNEFVPINFDENSFEEAMERLSFKKAMGYDQTPDEILKIPFIRKHVACFFEKMLKTGKIPQYLKYGRLCLLSKEKGNSFPCIENTRPIIILSCIYKLLELYWFTLNEDIIWNKIGFHQIGFRKKCGTQFNIILLKKSMKETKKSLVLFLDIKKAYDSVIREKLYDLLSYIGIPLEFVLFYKEMTTNMQIFICDNESISYTNGVPQGSCISPMLFNLYYEEALKKVSPFTELLLGYADDVAILLKKFTNLNIIQKELKNWDLDFNLIVHATKTEAILFNIENPENLEYPVCEKFVYLGTEIFNKKSQFTKTFIMNQINESAKTIKNLNLKMSTLKMRKLSVIWWYISKLLYKQISNIYLKNIPLDDFVQCANAKIKKLLNIHRSIPHNFVMNLLNIDIKKIAKNICLKIQKNCPTNIGKFFEEEIIVNPNLEKKAFEETHYWNYIMSTLDININSFYTLFQKTWWDAKLKIKCKVCNISLSFFHLEHNHKENYPFLNTDGFLWIKEVAEDFDFKGSLIKRKIGKNEGSKWIKNIMQIALETKDKAIKDLYEKK